MLMIFLFQVQFPGITGGNLMYVEEKLFRKKTEHHAGGDQQHVIPWENSIILEGNKIFTLTGLRPSTEYRLRWLAPDRKYPDVMVTTRGECFYKAALWAMAVMGVCVRTYLGIPRDEIGNNCDMYRRR